jgi:nitrile hydratase
MRVMLKEGAQFHADVPLAPRFSVGDKVRSRNYHPKGHTRLPRYARDKLGVVVRRQGVFYSPEFMTLEGQSIPQHVYTVRFAAETLWGETVNAGDAVFMDLWEGHLSPGEKPPL